MNSRSPLSAAAQSIQLRSLSWQWALLFAVLCTAQFVAVAEHRNPWDRDRCDEVSLLTGAQLRSPQGLPSGLRPLVP